MRVGGDKGERQKDSSLILKNYCTKLRCGRDDSAQIGCNRIFDWDGGKSVGVVFFFDNEGNIERKLNNKHQSIVNEFVACAIILIVDLLVQNFGFHLFVTSLKSTTHNIYATRTRPLQ